MGAGMLPERETQIDSRNPVIAELASSLFASAIAEGEVVVTDPPEAQAAPVAPPAAPATAPAAQAAPAVEAPVAPPAPTTEDVPDFKPKLNDDLQALLDEPDFDEEAELEVIAELEDSDGEYEYTDPEVAKKIRALEKRNAFLETQNVAKSRKGWIEEAKRAYPDLARLIPGEIEGTQATSRRAFLRAVDTANTRYATVLAPTLARLEADRAAIASGAVATAREEVANAWGRPAADTLPPLAAAQADALQKARQSGKLEEQIKVLMETTPVL